MGASNEHVSVMEVAFCREGGNPVLSWLCSRYFAAVKESWIEGWGSRLSRPPYADVLVHCAWRRKMSMSAWMESAFS